MSAATVSCITFLSPTPTPDPGRVQLIDYILTGKQLRGLLQVLDWPGRVALVGRFGISNTNAQYRSTHERLSSWAKQLHTVGVRWLQLTPNDRELVAQITGTGRTGTGRQNRNTTAEAAVQVAATTTTTPTAPVPPTATATAAVTTTTSTTTAAEPASPRRSLIAIVCLFAPLFRH